MSETEEVRGVFLFSLIIYLLEEVNYCLAPHGQHSRFSKRCCRHSRSTTLGHPLPIASHPPALDGRGACSGHKRLRAEPSRAVRNGLPLSLPGHYATLGVRKFDEVLAERPFGGRAAMAPVNRRGS